MNTRGALLAHAVRGPILLITIGVLFALHQGGVVAFQKTWPLLIIVVGLIKLVERSLTPNVLPVARPPYAPPPMPGGPAL